MSCNEKTKKWSNKDFEACINSYCSYLDSVGFTPDFDYIIVEAKKNDINTVFTIHLSGGAYHFLNEPEGIIDYFEYRGHYILLIGDFPNEIQKTTKNKQINIINDVIKKEYPEDYEKYLNNDYPFLPLIYDYMTMTLIFEDSRLVKCRRQYY